MTLKLELIRDKNKRLLRWTETSYTQWNFATEQIPDPITQTTTFRRTRENDFKRIYSSTYQRGRQITSKGHEYRNWFNLGRPINIGQKVFLENHTVNLSQNLQTIIHENKTITPTV